MVIKERSWLAWVPKIWENNLFAEEHVLSVLDDIIPGRKNDGQLVQRIDILRENKPKINKKCL